MLDNNILSAGKYRRLSRLSDSEGRFAMIAIDQRRSLRKMIGARMQVPPAAVQKHSLRLVKRIVTRALAPMATAVLTDPIYGHPASHDVFPSNVGLLLSAEVTGYETGGEAGRLSRLIKGWHVQDALRVGADGVKLLIWHHPEATAAVQRHQQEIVQSVGEACEASEMPFVLEALTYDLRDGDRHSPAFALRKSEFVIDAAATYSAPQYRVDLLKLEFPANLKYTEEYQQRSFGKGEVVYDRAVVEEACRRLDAASAMPWVLLSAGVDPEEFVENVRLANAAGASGVLCGRVVWKNVLEAFPDEAAMQAFVEGEGRRLFRMIRAANEEARPWPHHRRYQEGLPAEAVHE